MCYTPGTHTHDKDTERVSSRMVDGECRSCFEPAKVMATVYRRFSCTWTSYSKCGRCYL